MRLGLVKKVIPVILGTALSRTIHNSLLQSNNVASFPGPCPASRHLQYGIKSGRGLIASPRPAFCKRWIAGRGPGDEATKNNMHRNFTIAYRQNHTKQQPTAYAKLSIYRDIGPMLMIITASLASTAGLSQQRFVHEITFGYMPTYVSACVSGNKSLPDPDLTKTRNGLGNGSKNEL